MAHFSNCQNISRRRIAGKILFKGSELLWIVWIFNNLYCCRTWGRYIAWILRYIILFHRLSIMRMLMLFMTMPKSWWLCVHIWWRSTMPKDIRCQMHIAALQWESEQSMKRDCASGHTCDDIWASSQWWWWHLTMVMMIKMLVRWWWIAIKGSDLAKVLSRSQQKFEQAEKRLSKFLLHQKHYNRADPILWNWWS